MSENLKKLKDALKVLENSRKWIPELVVAMKDSKVWSYNSTFVENISCIPNQAWLVKENIEKEIEKESLFLKYKKIFKPGCFYEIHGKRDRCILAEIIKFNKHSVKIRVLAFEGKGEDATPEYITSMANVSLISIIDICQGSAYWITTLEAITKVLEVPKEDLLTYMSMNHTEHFSNLLKGTKL